MMVASGAEATAEKEIAYNTEAFEWEPEGLKRGTSSRFSEKEAEE